MLLGQELKFKNKLCNLKLGTFFSALPGLHPGGREQAEEHGGELPHLAASPEEAHRRSEGKG